MTNPLSSTQPTRVLNRRSGQRGYINRALQILFVLTSLSGICYLGYEAAKARKEKENLKPAKTYLTRLNNDRILDMVMVDGNGQYSAHVGYPDGNYMPFAKHQELQLSEFDKRQQAARTQFLTDQTREKEFVEQAVESIRQRDVTGTKINVD